MLIALLPDPTHSFCKHECVTHSESVTNRLVAKSSGACNSSQSPLYEFVCEVRPSLDPVTRLACVRTLYMHIRSSCFRVKSFGPTIALRLDRAYDNITGMHTVRTGPNRLIEYRMHLSNEQSVQNSA